MAGNALGTDHFRLRGRFQKNGLPESAGRTIEQLLADFPYVEEADILEALAFAARLAQGHEVRLAS